MRVTRLLVMFRALCRMPSSVHQIIEHHCGLRPCCVIVGKEAVGAVAGNHAKSLCQSHISIAVSRDAAIIHELGAIDAL